MRNRIWRTVPRTTSGVLAVAGAVLLAASVQAYESKVCPASGGDPVTYEPGGGPTAPVYCYINGSIVARGMFYEAQGGAIHDVRAGKYAALDQLYPNAHYTFAFAQGIDDQNQPTCTAIDHTPNNSDQISVGAACNPTTGVRISAWIGFIN